MGVEINIMKNCVYRFLNKDNKVIYVGKAKDLKSRLNRHTHLDRECYEEKESIEYIEFNTEDDMDFAERYYIMRLNPKYNTVLSDKDFSLSSIELDVKKWNKYLEDSDDKVCNCKDNESVKSLIEELKEIKIRIDTIRKFDLMWDKTGEKRFNDVFEELLNKEEELKTKIEEIIKYTQNNNFDDWIIEEFLNNCVFSIEDLIKNKIKDIEDKYYNKCKEQIIQYGYYKEEIYEEIDCEFICGAYANIKEKWKTLLEGTKNVIGMETYIINEEIKNKIVTSIIRNIEENISLKYGKIEKEIILLDSYAEYMKVFYPNYNYMKFKKPFVVYKVLKNN